jgi:hypothetical protein
MKKIIKIALQSIGISPKKIATKVLSFSVKRAAKSQGYKNLIVKLKEYVLDISRQEITEPVEPLIELRKRAMHAFQLKMMNCLVEIIKEEKGKNEEWIVVDIGDSAGTHMTYLKKDNPNLRIRTISVNLCLAEVERIRKKGMEAMHCRAEEIDLKNQKVDFFTSFQMVEHLHNPAIFFKRLASKGNSNFMLVTLPYLKNSKVALYKVREMVKTGIIPKDKIPAEVEHIFELSPEDWELLILHSGWKVVSKKLFYQYPPRGLSRLFLRPLWLKYDYEGFLGFILKRDTTYMNTYLDWED